MNKTKILLFLSLLSLALTKMQRRQRRLEMQRSYFSMLSRGNSKEKKSVPVFEFMYQISLVRASHWYREVTGSNHVEVLNFSGFHIRNFMKCVHNCEDHSLLESFPNWESNLRQFFN